MFKVETQKDIKWPVVINTPRSGGGITQERITVEFELIGVDEYNAIFSDGGSDKDLLRRVVKNWDGVKNVNGDPMDFTPENLETVIDIPHARSGLVDAYVDMSFGKKAARKN